MEFNFELLALFEDGALTMELLLGSKVVNLPQLLLKLLYRFEDAQLLQMLLNFGFGILEEQLLDLIVH